MTTLATNTDVDNDLFLDNNNNIALLTDGRNIVKQLSINKLQTFLGEVFTDLAIGLNFFGILINENLPVKDKISEITRILLQVPGVTDVESVLYEQDKQKREVTMTAQILTDVGKVDISDIIVGY